jgi:hypothetical protein
MVGFGISSVGPLDSSTRDLDIIIILWNNVRHKMASYQYSQYIQQKFFISFTPSNLVVGLVNDNTVYQNRDISGVVKFTEGRSGGTEPTDISIPTDCNWVCS